MLISEAGPKTENRDCRGLRISVSVDGCYFSYKFLAGGALKRLRSFRRAKGSGMGKKASEAMSQVWAG